jgi:hypothetical protein
MKDKLKLSALILASALFVPSLALTIDITRQNSIHTMKLGWSPQLLEPFESVEGYVANWTSHTRINILQIDVWMGKPYDILWEGDAILTTDIDVDVWHPNEDEVLIHYQFDSHAPSPLTHFRSFNLRPGFIVEADTTLYVWRLFNSFDVKATNAGDGWMRLYYIYM